MSDSVHRTVPTSALENATVKKGWVWAALIFPHDGRQVRLGGLTNDNAVLLVQAAAELMRSVRAQEERKRAAEARLEDEEQRQRQQELDTRRKLEYERLKVHLSAIAKDLTALLSRDRYLRNYDIQHLLRQRQDDIPHLAHLVDLLGSSTFDDDCYQQQRQRMKIVADFIADPASLAKSWNKSFVAKERNSNTWQTFFKNIERQELTPEQQEAVVVHEDRNRLVAAAGSGKSSTLVAKAGYAIRKGYVEPSEVLALAFNKKAAQEIRERLHDRTGLAIQAQTFHSLGLDILTKAGGRKQLKQDDKQVIQKLITERSNNDPQFLTQLLLFKTVHWETEPERDFPSVEEYEKYIRAKGRQQKKQEREQWGIPSLRGEPVKSYEELAIANWLWLHEVDYSYEPQYEHDVARQGWSKYQPDFVYQLADGRMLYHEHFALRSDQTSPFGQSYVKSAQDKRALHASYGTLLIETTSAQFRDGSVFERLQSMLTSHGVTLRRKSSVELSGLLRDRTDRDLVKLMSALISHGKESGYDEAHFMAQARRQRDVPRALVFLQLLLPIWKQYTAYRETNQQIDFSDMISQAAIIAEAPGYSTPFKLILVDEFQDISPGRARLVKALLAHHPDSVLFGVGDDWQAINRFAGSDLAIMRNFEQHFGRTETRYLGTTFRSNQGISDVAARFVMKNPVQLPKTVQARDPAKTGVVRIVEYDNAVKLKEQISAKLQLLAALAQQQERVISVLIIGRYQYDTAKIIAEADIDAWNLQYRGCVEIRKIVDEKKQTSKPLDTVHKSKGMEADYVLVYGMQADYYAFPSEMENDPLLALSFAQLEPFEYAEERRLFYVALTRARQQVTLYTSSKTPSRFVIALLDKEYGDAVHFEGKRKKPKLCTQCRRGYMTPRKDKAGKPFWGCTQYPPHRLGCTNTQDQ